MNFPTQKGTVEIEVTSLSELPADSLSKVMSAIEKASKSLLEGVAGDLFTFRFTGVDSVKAPLKMAPSVYCNNRGQALASARSKAKTYYCNWEGLPVRFQELRFELLLLAALLDEDVQYQQDKLNENNLHGCFANRVHHSIYIRSELANHIEYAALHGKLSNALSVLEKHRGLETPLYSSSTVAKWLNEHPFNKQELSRLDEIQEEIFQKVKKDDEKSLADRAEKLKPQS